MIEARNATPLTVAALVYLAITLPLTWLARRLEKRGARGRAGSETGDEQKNVLAQVSKSGIDR
jgi:hypothetical protein